MRPSPAQRVLVGMSGGVDSSVAALLLKETGHRVSGVFMRTWQGGAGHTGARGGCYGPDGEDLAAARETAAHIGIPFLAVDLAKEFQARVLSYFTAEYRAGRTPNPCVICNRLLKFDALLAAALDAGVPFDRFATGHYARVEPGEDGAPRLKAGRDAAKDQSYFLALLTREQLERAVFPLGGMTKEEVRRLARERDLPARDRPESQDFFPGDPTALFAEQPPGGPIMDRSGTVLGTHRGIHRYTIGQRKGLGISSRLPLYVVAIDARVNALIVGPEADCYRDALTVTTFHPSPGKPLEGPLTARVKIRSAHPAAAATITPLPGGGARVRFAKPQWAITPGQLAVAYDGDAVIGAGFIGDEPPRA